MSQVEPREKLAGGEVESAQVEPREKLAFGEVESAQVEPREKLAGGEVESAHLNSTGKYRKPERLVGSVDSSEPFPICNTNRIVTWFHHLYAGAEHMGRNRAGSPLMNPTRIVPVRITESEMSEIMITIARRNLWSSARRWDLSKFIRKAIWEKIRKMHRSRSRKR